MIPTPEVNVLTVARSGAEHDENEDVHGLDLEKGLVVLVDGAGGGFDAQGWSRCFVQAVLEQPAHGAALPEGSLLNRAYGVAVDRYGRRPAVELPPGLEPRGSGACAALIRLVPGSDAIGRWSLEVVGDVSLILARRGSIPRGREDLLWTDYSTTPDLLWADRSTARCLRSGPHDIESGDIVMLFTDGLGPWITRYATNSVIDSFRRMNDRQFTCFVDSLRDTQRVPDDDATLVLLHFPG